jgi:23S rRNA U2552 (ribose-2'-O)-methylase RlmE/FtsJ
MSNYLLNDFINVIEDENILVLYDSQSKSAENVYKLKYNYINVSLRNYLHNIKKEIDSCVDKWEKYKRYSNTYEFINTNFSFNGRNITVCPFKPISRSYFKMVEILGTCNFAFNQKSIQSFHLAEGPGGFIEALCKFRNNKHDNYFGMTLMEDHADVPRWKKASHFLSQHKNVHLVHGPKNDGNLYFKHNLIYVSQFFRHKMDFITADGGFDFSTDFNAQEESSLNLVFCEIIYAIVLQKKGGSFVLKVFDCFSNVMVELLYLLCYLYDEVSIMKPCTSRSANSEKYIVCKRFRMVNNMDRIISKLVSNFDKINDHQIMNVLNIEVSDFFKNKLEELNYLFGQQQIENISHTLNLINDNINDEKVERIKHQNISKCIKWCRKYKLDINKELLNFREF